MEGGAHLNSGAIGNAANGVRTRWIRPHRTAHTRLRNARLLVETQVKPADPNVGAGNYFQQFRVTHRAVHEAAIGRRVAIATRGAPERSE